MKWVVFLLKAILGVILIGVLGAALYLFIAPPDLLRVAANYSAKIVCSNVFVAGRDATDVQNIDVQAGGHPILGYINVDVDEPGGVVTARLLGLFATGTAVYREGLGCASVPDGEVEGAKAIVLDSGKIESYFIPSDWAMDDHNLAIDDILADEKLVGPAMRAVVVIKDGKLLGETYGPDFEPSTPLLGWSMTKTITGLIFGTLPTDMAPPTRNQLFTDWQADQRSQIALGELLSMNSGLQWNEGYGSVSDVTRMLYLQSDMTAFASSLPLKTDDEAPSFHYSSGTSVLLSRIWQDSVGEAALEWPHQKLFGPIGMSSATLETDAAGTYVGSSYLYASARDWVRIGQLILQEGIWGGRQIVPADYIKWMTSPAQTSMAAWGKPQYGNGQIWMRGPTGNTPKGTNADEGFDLPDDTRWLLGHDGQSIAIIPSKGLVVVRMGLTPSKLGYKSQPLVKAILNAFEQ